MKLFNCILALSLGLAQAAAALEPPPPGDSRLPVSGPAFGGENRNTAPHLLARWRARLLGDKGFSAFPDWGHSLPAVGSPRILVLLVDFDDYPARPGDTPEAISAKIFGSAGKFPYESLSSYYKRASYGKLNITGDVLGWFRAGRRADVPETYQGREAVIKKALENYRDLDLSRYDSDGDGFLDYVVVIWAGPMGKWATFWWGSASSFSDAQYRVKGKGVGVYSWQGVTNSGDDPGAEFSPRTLIHETGHALGLPDYYDYKPDVGPKGGLGGFDMMDGTEYDHNCFSKMLLGWTEPREASASGEYKLRPSLEAGDCIMVMPHGAKRDKLGEFFLLENRRPEGNDYSRVIGGGLTVWHVDARLNAAGNGFRYNNQETEHKLLKILESGGKEGLELGEKKIFLPTDFYREGRALGPDTTPSSRLYDGTDTGISLVSRGGDPAVSFTLTIK